MTDNCNFEFGFYTPGTRKARLIEAAHKVRDGQIPQYRNKQTKQQEPVVARREKKELQILRNTTTESPQSNPRVTLNRKGNVSVTGPFVYISCTPDEKDRSETRKRELLIRDKVSNDKSEQNRRWTQALINCIDDSLVCL
jgi:hypothetical protein